MIAVDTSSLVAYLSGASGADVEMVSAALETHQAILPPIVLTELLSDPKLIPAARTALTGLPLLALSEGYWERAGRLRSSVLSMRRKARLGDALIAQSCLDASVPLVTRDKDFRNFAASTDLVLL